MILTLKGLKMTVSTFSMLDQVAQKFNFSVDKFPLSGPDGLRTPMYGLFRSDTGEVVSDSSVSSKYTVHTTDDVLAIVEATGEVFENCQADCYFKNGHYVRLAPTKEMRKSIYGTADNIFPRLNISAGFDGESFRVYMGYFRDLCLNMSRMKSVKTTYFKIRHSSNLRPKMNELIDQFAGLKQGWEDLGQMITRMESAQVSLSSFLDSIYKKPEADSGREVTIHKNRTEAIFKRLLDERRRSGRPQIGSDFMVSAWEAYNSIQGYVQHDATRSKNANAYDRILSATSDPAVLKAEELAYNLCA